MTRPSIPRTALWLALGVLATLGGLAVFPPAAAQTAEEFTFRIAARLHENETHLEFGIQRIDDQGTPRVIHLPAKRFFRLNLDHHRWLSGDSAVLYQAPHFDFDLDNPGGVEAPPPSVRSVPVRPVARIHPTRNLVEFGAAWELDAVQLPDSDSDAYADPVFPSKRIFPANVDHHRWLYSDPLSFTRVWDDRDSMDSDGSMEEDGTQANPPPSVTTESCVAEVERERVAMTPDLCKGLLYEYCLERPTLDWCDDHRVEPGPVAAPATLTICLAAFAVAFSYGEPPAFAEGCEALLREHCDDNPEEPLCREWPEESAPVEPSLPVTLNNCIVALGVGFAEAVEEGIEGDIVESVVETLPQACEELLGEFCDTNAMHNMCRILSGERPPSDATQ